MEYLFCYRAKILIMRQLHLYLIVIFFSIFGYAQNIYNYKISKPYCVLNFMQTASGAQGTSFTYRDYINEKTVNDFKFKALVDDFSKLSLHFAINNDDSPVNRKQSTSTYDLIIVNAVNSYSFDELKSKCLGIIPFETNSKLYTILNDAEKIYDNIVWQEYRIKADQQLLELSRFKNYNEQIFRKIKKFYDSAWSSDIPFEIAIYPIPGVNGYATATPHVNSLCVGVFTEEKDHVRRNGVVLHEMCHILFKEQRLAKQFEIDGYFKTNNTLYSKFAYSYLDEALATAIGNGWAYNQINKKIDEGEWYADKTINEFAKLIYPMVEEYMHLGMSIDKNFIDKSIKIFANNFSKAIQEYAILLNKTTVYTDEMSQVETVNLLSEYFQIYSLSFSSPILHNYSYEFMENAADTQFFVITKNQQQIFTELKKRFSQIDNYEFKGKPMNLSFFDSKGRAVIMLVLNNKEELKSELQKLKSQVYFDIKQPLQY
jgi:hypothetical protein